MNKKNKRLLYKKIDWYLDDRLYNYRVFIAIWNKVNAFFDKKIYFSSLNKLKKKIEVGHLWISENFFLKTIIYVRKSLVCTYQTTLELVPMLKHVSNNIRLYLYYHM